MRRRPPALIGALISFDLVVATAIGPFGSQSGAVLATVVGVMVAVVVSVCTTRLPPQAVLRAWYRGVCCAYCHAAWQVTPAVACRSLTRAQLHIPYCAPVDRVRAIPRSSNGTSANTKAVNAADTTISGARRPPKTCW